jgi:RNA-binding protein NOB1
MENTELSNINKNQKNVITGENLKDENNLNKQQTKYVVDTAFFIKLRPIDTNFTYYTTKFVVDEIKDEKAREHYQLNKEFIIVKNPQRESMKKLTSFTKKSNDLFNLSIPDLSILALAYEINSTELSNIDLMRAEPIEFKIIKRENKNKKENIKEYDEDGFEIVNSNKVEDEEDNELDFETVWGQDDSEWINSNNLENKLSKFKSYEQTSTKSVVGNFVVSDDFTIQNVCLKMGINIISVNGMIVKGVKNYLLKCYSCNTFNYDTNVLFCKECGYNTLMKIGYKVNEKGEGVIYDKDAEKRNRGVQFDLPKPTVGKKATVYVLAEDQLPNYVNNNKKKEIDIEGNLDKILENYDQYKDLLKIKQDKRQLDGQSSKNFIWGYPKQNPNQPNKYYGKKTKKAK